MANKTINQLTNLGSVDDSDEFVVFDVSTDETKKVTKGNLLSGMQKELTFDDTPTNGSNNPVKSGGIYNALSGKAKGETFTLTNENPKSVNLPKYRCGILGGFAQDIGTVLIAIFNEGGSLTLTDLKNLSSFSNANLSFTLSGDTLTITSSSSSGSAFTFIPLGF